MGFSADNTGKEIPLPMQQMQGMWFQTLDGEDTLEKEMETHSSILAWRIPWTEKPGGLYSPWGLKESDMTEMVEHTHTQLRAAYHS